jgi:serine/threonine-protein kinase
MDYVAGADLARLLRDEYPGGMPVDQVLPIITALASALDYAHHRGLLHRDVKPANILLTDPDEQQRRRVFLADFGIARHVDDAAGLTATKTAVGTVAYAAPEQLKAEAVDGRADQYALACTAFHMLAGVPPYGSSNPAVVITGHVSAPPPSIGANHPELGGLDPVFAKAMAKEPSDRFGSCREFAEQLSHHRSAPSLYAQHTRLALGATAPTLPPQQAPPTGKRRRGVLIGALVGAALLIAGGVFAVVALVRQPDSATNAGPLSGTYRTDFGPIVRLEETADPNAAPELTATYGLRSVCRPTGCVATASRLSGPPVAMPTMVFDQINGHWVAVAVQSDQCRDASAEFWQVFTLQPRPDGSLAGEYTATAAKGCADKRIVTLTRTGGVDESKVADPARQPARVASPAEALHGSYRTARTFANGSPQQQLTAAATTACLRTGDRCMSYLREEAGFIPLVFGAGKWNLQIDDDGQCPQSGETTRIKNTGTYPLPQPAQNPIALLTGHGHHEQSEPCAMSVDFDETLTRTGD